MELELELLKITQNWQVIDNQIKVIQIQVIVEITT